MRRWIGVAAAATAAAALLLPGSVGAGDRPERGRGHGEVSSCKASPVPEDGPAAAAVAAARQAMEDHDLKAVLLRVLEDGEEVVTVALGESMTGVPATTDMHFRNGAVSISYLATVLLQLADEGVVGLDDPIGNWLPDLPDADRVTLRMLAQSTSGYRDYVPMDDFLEALVEDPFRAWQPEELLAYGFSAPPWYEPGTNWSYSHTGFVVLGEALEAITGTPVAELIRERVLEPLGLRQTASFQTAHIPDPVLHAYSSDRGLYEDATFWDPSWTIAEGAVMITDICDLATSGRAIGTGALVSEASHELQVGDELVGLGGPTESCPVCLAQVEQAHYGVGTVVLNGWVLQNPAFNGFGAVQAHLPGADLTIAASATLTEEATNGVNGGMLVFTAVAEALAPDHPPIAR